MMKRQLFGIISILLVMITSSCNTLQDSFSSVSKNDYINDVSNSNFLTSNQNSTKSLPNESSNMRSFGSIPSFSNNSSSSSSSSTNNNDSSQIEVPDQIVVSADENGHWYHNVLNNYEIEYAEHTLLYGFDGVDFYKKCSFCEYTAKTVIEINEEVNEDYFVFYELDNGTYGVGPSSLLPRNSETKINLTLPESHLGKPVTEIVKNAFFKNENDQVFGYNLGTVVIPSSIKRIKEGAFCSTFLDCLIIKDGLEEIESFGFAMCTSFLVFLPRTIKNLNPTAFYKSRVEKMVVDEHNDFYKSVQGAVYSKDCKTLCLFPSNYTNDFDILDGTINIGEAAFASSHVEKVAFPSSIREIGENAFAECRSQGVILNNGLEIIGSKAFEGSSCFKEEVIEIPSSVNDIGQNAFNYGLGSAKTIVLPISLITIETNLLSNNWKLEECIIGANVKTIKKEFLLGNPLKSLRYTGSKEQWNTIELQNGWNILDKEKGLFVKQVICSDGVIDF